MAAAQVLRLLLFDEQLDFEFCQQLLADDTSARLDAYLSQRTWFTADRPLALTVTELQAAVLQLAKQGFLEHSRSIRLSKLGGGGAKPCQPGAKQAPGSAAGAPPCPSAFPALPSAARGPPATPTAATPTSSWATSIAAVAGANAAGANAATPANASAPSPASISGAPASGARLQGAWAQGPLASMSNKKQAALDERLRGRTPPVPSPAEGTWAAPSPSASTGSTSSAPAGAWGKNGRHGGPRHQHTPAGPGQGQGQGGTQDGGGCWASGLPPTGGRAGCAASPGAPNGTPNQQTRPMGAWAQQGQGPVQGGVKRVVPVPVQQQHQQHQQQQDQHNVPTTWSSPSYGLASCNPSPAVSAAAGAMNAWGVPPVNTSKQQQLQRQANQQRTQQQQPAIAAADGPVGEEAVALATAGDISIEPDPSTPGSAVATPALGGAPALTTPTSAAAVDPAAGQQNDPVTPAAQIVPAVSAGSLSQHDSVVQNAFRARYCSPPSVTSYPQGRPPVGPSRPVLDALARLPQVEEGPASLASAGPVARCGQTPGGAAGPQVGAGSGGLGAVWGSAHERLARLHAGVLCAGSVPCLQDEVSELLYLLACPPEVLLATEVDGGGAAAVSAGAAASDGKGSVAAPAGAQDQLEWPLHVAVQYGCAVLSRCGGLLSGLGHRLLAAVATCAAARLTAPALATAADEAAQRREPSLARSRAVDALAGQRLQMVGPMLQSGNDMASGKSRSQEQQRRVSNRERCRDLFFAVVRQAAPLLNRGGGDCGGLSDSGTVAGGGGRGSSAAAGQTPPPPAAASGPGVSAVAADALVPLRAECLDVLQSLHPDNLPFFAELFTGCVLQAAATGESLVEGDLANLASRNPSKFQRLNQRMQQAPGQVLSQQHLTPSHHSQQQQSTPTQSGGRGSRTPGGGHADVVGYGAASAAAGGRLHGGPGGTPGGHSHGSTYGAFNHRGGGYPAGGSGGAYGTMAAGGGGGGLHGPDGGVQQQQPRDSFGVSARCAATLQRLSYFPPPQRPYIFFLEAVDSQSLVTAVSRHMAGVLQAMLLKALGVSGPASGSGAHGHSNGGCSAIEPSPVSAVGPLGDYVVATGTLASYLAYLSVVHGAVRYGVALLQPRGARPRAGGDSPVGRAPQPPDAPPQPLRPPHHPPLDVLQLLCVAEERGVLVHVVPCVAQYLYIITNGARISSGSAADAVSSAAADGGDALGSGIIDSATLQLPYLQAISRRLRRLLASRALQPQQEGFCSAALCLRSAAEEALSHAAAVATAADGVSNGGGGGAARLSDEDGECSRPWRRLSRGGEVDPAEAALAPGASDQAIDRDTRLARSLQESDGLVDSRFLELCCPAIEAASRVLQRASAAAAKLLLQQQHTAAAGGGGGATTPGAAAAAAAAAGSPGSAGAEPRPLMPRRVPPAALVRLGSAGTGGGGTAAAPIPESVAAVLSAPGPSPLQQALAQALLGQYSTGEHAVPMRDVVSYVTGVLAVNGAAAALELIVPQVASEHLARLAESVRPVLQERVRRWQDDAATAAALAAAALAAAGRQVAQGDEGNTAADTPRASAAAPPVLPISEAMAAAAVLADEATAAATAASLGAALPAVRRQLRENALRSLQALLPGTVPEEAVAAAAVLAAQSAEVACLQRLVAHVPAAVRSHMDEQVKHVVREVVRDVERQAADATRLLLPPPPPPPEQQQQLQELPPPENAELKMLPTGTAAAAGEAVGAAIPQFGLDVGTAQLPSGSETTAPSVDTSASRVEEVPLSRAAETVAEAAAPTVTSAREEESRLANHLGAGRVSVGDQDDVDVDERAADAGRRLSGVLMELARRPADPPLDEIIHLTVQSVRQAVALPPVQPHAGNRNGDGGGEGAGGAIGWVKSPAAALAAAASASRRLYDAIRGGELEAPALEHLLVRCLRAGCAAAASGAAAAAAAWEARPAPALLPPAPGGPAAAEIDVGAATLAFLAEVSLGIAQCNADDSHTWIDVVWQPAPAAELDILDPDEQDSDARLSECAEPGLPADGPSELGSCSGGLPASDSTSLASGSGSPGSTNGGAAAAASRPTAALPPMLANLYHHLAAYSRDVESYRMLHALRMALQRATLGHLTRRRDTGAAAARLPAGC